MAMMRSYMRSQITNQPFDTSKLERLGLTERQMTEMYRLLGIAKYEDRFVVPSSHKETYLDTYKAQGSQGYGGEYFGSNCEGCGVAVQSGKLDKKFIMKISMEGSSVINLEQLSLYQDSLGYLGQQMNFPENDISSKNI